MPEGVAKRLEMASADRALRLFAWLFAVLVATAFASHLYWARRADVSEAVASDVRRRDQRIARVNGSSPRGRVLDRTGDLTNALALYRATPAGKIARIYPMDRALVHLLGSPRINPGFEQALFGASLTTPESLSVLLGTADSTDDTDVRLTISAELQRLVAEQMGGRRGAVVAIDPQTGDVLALYSSLAPSIAETSDDATWIRMEADERGRPLENRSLHFFYVPGSTFKTVTMIAAYLAGMQNEKFTCSSGGFIAQPGAAPIFDSGGASEVHGHIGLDTAYEVSCNQYFAQLAVKLGPDGLKAAARLLGIGTYDSPDDALRPRRQPELWNASSPAVASALAPNQSAIVTRNISRLDLAYEGFGQGYAGQMTPFQMALVAAAVGNTSGKLMKPKIEYDVAPVQLAQVVSPQQAADMRRIMGLVTGAPSGTARGAFAKVGAAGITTGGKTGTAQKEVPLYKPTGEILKRMEYERDSHGNVIREYERVVMAPQPRVDSWFICLAPLDQPRVAIAVVVEGGGAGARAAAPIAAAVVLKAQELGLLRERSK
jgi:cell division protein FtsI/penicillin-binding protein 2